jgi:hypothetical protein
MWCNWSVCCLEYFPFFEFPKCVIGRYHASFNVRIHNTHILDVNICDIYTPLMDIVSIKMLRLLLCIMTRFFAFWRGSWPSFYMLEVGKYGPFPSWLDSYFLFKESFLCSVTCIQIYMNGLSNIFERSLGLLCKEIEHNTRTYGERKKSQ